MAAKKSDPAPSTPTDQSGPAQGADPSVVIARPDDAATSETDAGALQQMDEDNGAGPRQEPVRRQTTDLSDGEADPAKQPKAGEKGAPENIVSMGENGNSHESAYNPAVEPVKPKKHGKTTDEDVDALARELIKALETQGVTTGGDGYGRTYEFYTTNMNNQSVVMAVVKRDGMAQQIPVSTSQLSLPKFMDGDKEVDPGLDAARDAVRALDGMLV